MGINREIYFSITNSWLGAALTIISILTLGAWLLLFVLSRNWFKTRIQLSVKDSAAQDYWRYRYGLSRLFGARRVMQVLGRERLIQEFKYDFNISHKVALSQTGYGVTKSIDLNLNIEAHAIETKSNVIGEFLEGIIREATKTTSKWRPPKRISFPRTVFRVALAAVILQVARDVSGGALHPMGTLFLLGILFFVKFISYRDKEIPGISFIASRAKLKWTCVGILVFFAVWLLPIIIYVNIGLSLRLPIDDPLLSYTPGSILRMIVLSLLFVWFYSEVNTQKAWFFLPNGIYESESCKIFPYQEIGDTKFYFGQFLQSYPVPVDASVTKLVWEHQNQDGTADLRFNSNKQLPSMHVGYMSLATETGLDLILQVSDWYRAMEFGIFWANHNYSLNANHYLNLMLTACTQASDEIVTAANLNKHRGVVEEMIENPERFHDKVLTMSYPAQISSLVLGIAAQFGLHEGGVGNQLEYPTDLIGIPQSPISPKIYGASSLIFSDGNLKYSQGIEPADSLSDRRVTP